MAGKTGRKLHLTGKSSVFSQMGEEFDRHETKPPQDRAERYQSDSSQYQSWIEKLCQTFCAKK